MWYLFQNGKVVSKNGSKCINENVYDFVGNKPIYSFILSVPYVSLLAGFILCGILVLLLIFHIKRKKFHSFISQDFCKSNSLANLMNPNFFPTSIMCKKIVLENGSEVECSEDIDHITFIVKGDDGVTNFYKSRKNTERTSVDNVIML